MSKSQARDVSNKHIIDANQLSLEEWLALIENTPSDSIVPDYCFQNESHKQRYLDTIHKRSASDIKKLLFRFLPSDVPIGIDYRSLGDTIRWLREKPKHLDIPFSIKRYLFWGLTKKVNGISIYGGKNTATPRESIYWILDLLEFNPNGALQALNGYFQVYCQMLTDAQIQGIDDCRAIIRTWFEVLSVPENVISNLSPREFECLVYNLFSRMNYDIQLTKKTRDGGKDIIAEKPIKVKGLNL